MSNASALLDAFSKSAEQFPDKVALQDTANQTTSFSTLAGRTESIANRLIDFGTSHQTRVVILSGNSIAAIEAYWAIIRIGAIAVWIDEKKSRSEIVELVNDCEPIAILCSSERLVDKITDEGSLDSRVILLSELLENPSPSDNNSIALTAQQSDIATIVYTSGSSGTPKGVCLTHESLAAVAKSVVQHMPIHPTDSYLMLVPLHYVHGLMQLLVHMMVAATIHLASGFQFPRAITRQIVDRKVSGFSGVPFHFSALVERGGLLDQELPDLRWVTSTGGALAPNIARRFTQAHADIEFHVAYGQTECSPRATALHPSKLARKPESVGAAIPGVNVQIIDETGAELPQGEVGEVVISGRNVMAGYWRDPEATSKAIDKMGRLHTGDLGHFDDEGDLFLDGRISEMIKTAGERISPAQIESTLVASEYVSDAVISGLPDEMYGSILLANIQCVSTVEEHDLPKVADQLLQECVATHTFSRSPRQFIFWRKFPSLPNGKIDRKQVAQQAVSPEDNQLVRIRPGHTKD